MAWPVDPEDSLDGRAHFPFLDGLRGEVAALLRFTTEENLQAFDAGARFLRSEAGRSVMEGMTRDLLEGGYLGQQLCSSPTEAYFVGDLAAAEAFARQMATALEAAGGAGERPLGDGAAMLLDRVRSRCEEAGSTVIVPASEDTSWTLVVSAGRSVFTCVPPPPALPIHGRSGFLEIIAVPDLASVAAHVCALPAAPCHGEIAGVQTILRVARLDEMEALMRALRGRGGVYRVVPPSFVLARHALEPLDGQHLIAAFTRQMVLL